MNFWVGKKVLVTGATGCAGSNLIKFLLESGANVRALVRNPKNLRNLKETDGRIVYSEGDVENVESIQKAVNDIDYIFHLAAIVPVVEARKDPIRTFKINVLGTFNVAQAALESGVKRFLHVSSSHVYGNQPEEMLPLRETTTPNPNDVYSTSKHASEIILKSVLDQGLDVVIARGFGYFGPGQTEDFLTAKVISSILKNQRPNLGSPDSTRDYSYIANIVEGYAAAAEKGRKGETYNICSGKEILIGNFVKKIIEVSGSSLEPTWNTSVRKSDISRQYGDNSKAVEELDWRQRFTLEQGLKITIEWWKNKIRVEGS